MQFCEPYIGNCCFLKVILPTTCIIFTPDADMMQQKRLILNIIEKGYYKTFVIGTSVILASPEIKFHFDIQILVKFEKLEIIVKM